MEISSELRSLVSSSVALLGEVIRRELGLERYQFIERLRAEMSEIRGKSTDDAFPRLEKHLEELSELKPKDRLEVAHAFTLMLELMNVCENAYRIHSLDKKGARARALSPGDRQNAIIYVLTAHPTEARSPKNIEVFHQIQDVLVKILSRARSEFSAIESAELRHFLEVAWRVPVVRKQKPQVKDEAEHIYSLLFREDVLFSLLNDDERGIPFFARTWVGGDKDGHPGVNDKVMLESLGLSRRHLLGVIAGQVAALQSTLEFFSSKKLVVELTRFSNELRKLKTLAPGDGVKASRVHSALHSFKKIYKEELGELHPALIKLKRLMRAFPGFVVPLELRESSDMLGETAILKMLKAIHRVSRGADPRWYARGFIISMTHHFTDIQAAARLQKSVFGELRIPVIPLFEDAEALKSSSEIVSCMVKDPSISRAARKNWDGMMEMMVGYSDSSKEGGVLASRVAIAKALPRLEKICLEAGFQPVFFHGSGGSVDRGGGSIEDQTAWWPRSALRRYKATIQGEMIERSLASPEIARRRLDTIADSVQKGLQLKDPRPPSKAVETFAKRVSSRYRATIGSPDFLKVVENATPYSFLNVLRIGSRPTKRSVTLTIKGLRAIPWVLCWTQTRVLFPTWWGVGSAWDESSKSERDSLCEAFRSDPAFTSYVKALGFTLAKVRLHIWKLYLTDSKMQNEFSAFETEFKRALQAYRDICGHEDLMWYRPWLGESIKLRSSAIHPLNLLQILAKRDGDSDLLRLTVTGVASGMLTTG
jgi:phosphoenolpyruvate carboxylase